MEGMKNDQNQLNNVIGAAQETVELIEITNNEISNVEEKITDNAAVLQTLETSSQDMQNMINSKIFQIEHAQNITNELKDYNVNFLSSAQKVYNSTLELNQMILLEEKKNDELIKMFEDNEEKFKALSAEMDDEEKKLLSLIEKAKNEKMLMENKKKHIVEENCCLQKELHESKNLTLKAEKKMQLAEEEQKSYIEDINQLKEDIIKADEKIAYFEKLEAAEEKQKEEIIRENIQNYDKKIIELEAKLNKILESELETRTSEENHKKELEFLKTSKKEADQQLAHMINRSEMMVDEYENIEGNFKKEEDNFKEIIKKHELELTHEKKIHETLIIHEKNLEDNFALLETEINALETIIKKLESRPKSDVKEQLEIKADILQGLKPKYEQLKEEQKRRVAEKQNELEKEIILLENDNSKMEIEIELMEKETNEIKEKTNQIEKKKLELEKELQDLERRNNKMLISNRPRNWDSDTTFEEEDTSYAERALKQVRSMSGKKK